MEGRVCDLILGVKDIFHIIDNEYSLCIGLNEGV